MLILTVAALAQQGNPYCDYHNQYFNPAGQEYPNGICYNVYTHLYWQGGQRYVHRMTMKCQ
jgi:hypothetical protein